MSTTVCPKCSYARTSADTAPAWQCPRCGVAYAKVAATAQPAAAPRTPSPAPRQPVRGADDQSFGADDDLDPVAKAPGLTTINGFGFKLYGRSDEDPVTGSFMATHYFVLLFIPFVPLARYRVIREGDSYYFLGKGRLRTIDKAHLGIAALQVLWFYLANRR